MSMRITAAVEPGQELPAVEFAAIDRVQLAKYAGASGDFNPVHLDEPFAREAGYPTVIAQGMLSMGLVGRVAKDLAGPGAVVEVGARFAAITWPGDVLAATPVVKERREVDGRTLVDLEITLRNQKGEVTTRGYATVAV